MEHFFPNPRESERIVGRVAFSHLQTPIRYYATLGVSIQGAFCTLLHDSPSECLQTARRLSRLITQA
jgi:hypothetical protein